MDYVFVCLVTLITVYFSVRIAGINNLSFTFVSILYMYHLMISIFFYFYYLTGGSDSDAYYNIGKLISTSEFLHPVFSSGSSFIIYLVSIIYSVFPISKFSFFYLFSQFGFFGLFFLYAVLKTLANLQQIRWPLLIIFMPGLSFFTSALGKDAFIFLPICYLLYLFSKNDFNVMKLGFSVTLIFMVRPHIAFIFIISFCLSLILTRKELSITYRIILLAFVSYICVMIEPFVGRYIGLDNISIENVITMINKRAGYNQLGTTSIDIRDYSFVMKLFTYAFRPLFFDSPGLLGLVVSFENTIYLIILISLIRLDFIRFIMFSREFSVYFSLIFSFLMLVVLSLTTTNMGIAIRQKVMFLPFTFYFIFYFNYWRYNGYNLSLTDFPQLAVGLPYNSKPIPSHS